MVICITLCAPSLFNGCPSFPHLVRNIYWSSWYVSSVRLPFRFQSWPDVSSWPSRIYGTILAPPVSVIRGLFEQRNPDLGAVAKGLGSDLSVPLVSTEVDAENPAMCAGRRTMSQTEGEFGERDYVPPRMPSRRGSDVEMPERASSARPSSNLS